MPTRTQSISDWLASNPGWHTPTQVANGVGLPTQPVASTLLYLHRHGRILRKRGKVQNGPGSSWFAGVSDPPTSVTSNGSP